jgi:hypothetical protein
MKMISIFVLALFVVAPAQDDHEVLNSQPSTTLCALLNRPAEYSGKTIRLTATVLPGLEFSILSDDDCPSKVNPASGKHDLVLVTNSESRKDFKSTLNKKLTKLLRKNQQAEITAVGAFKDPGQYMGHQLCCRYEFVIQELIAVQDVGKWNRPKELGNE